MSCLRCVVWFYISLKYSRLQAKTFTLPPLFYIMTTRSSTLVEGPAEESRQQVLGSGHAYTNETSWKIGKKRGWCWVRVTEGGVLFKIDRSRSRETF